MVVAGGGKIGEAVAKTFLADGHEVAIVEVDPERVNYLSMALHGRFMMIQGDCCDIDTLVSAGIEDADVLCALTSQDDTNLAVCEISSTLFKVSRCIARVNDQHSLKIFNKLEIGTVSSTDLVTEEVVRMARDRQARTGSIFRNDRYAEMEFEIPESSSLKAEGGRLVSEIELPPFSALVAVLQKGMVQPIGPQTVLLPGDTVLAYVREDSRQDLRKALFDL